MLLNFPSGFYRTLLPPAPDNKGNVTYTISGEEPPRGILFFLRINNNLSVNSPALIATAPQGRIDNSALTSHRVNVPIDREPRPIGSILEFVDRYRTLDVQSDALKESVDFPRFSNSSTDPINQKLLDAYQINQKELLMVSQASISKQVEIDNLERGINTSIASLQATEEALKVLIDDADLLAVVVDLNNQIENSKVQIDFLADEIIVLDERRNELSDAVRRLSKVIS
jgi:hypothetical protein